MLTDDELFAALDADVDEIAEARADTESWDVIKTMAAAIESAVLAKLTAGVAVPDLRDFAISDRAHIELIAAFHQYGASQRLAGREQVLKEATDLDWTAIMCEGCLVTWENAETLGCHAVEHIRALAASPQEQT